MKKNAYQGFPFELVKTFSKYLLKSLQLLNEENIIHCDLKPVKLSFSYVDVFFLKEFQFYF